MLIGIFRRRSKNLNMKTYLDRKIYSHFKKNEKWTENTNVKNIESSKNTLQIDSQSTK